MTEHRFLDISDEGMRIRAASGRLLVERGHDVAASIPMTDLDAAVVAHTGATISQAALAGLAKAGCGVVICDDKRLPESLQNNYGKFRQGGAERQRFFAPWLGQKKRESEHRRGINLP